jgi:amino acid transporter
MGALASVKKLLIGKPIHRKHAHHERLIIPFGLAIFASDALSSVAYATEEILRVLVFAGAAAMTLATPISLWLGLLLVIIAFSYYQTIQAYPKGGGTYLVSSENLGTVAGRIAGGSLLVDYVLTVAVSISSGVAAVVSLNGHAYQWRLFIACGAVVLLCLANLRGSRESGLLFSIPTYTFVVLIISLVATCVFRGIGQPRVMPVIEAPPEGWHALTVLVILRAFAASCAALTGTEAIADGVQAFRAPEPKNATKTLFIMVTLMLVMFIGISWAAVQYGTAPMPPEAAGYKTIIAQLAAHHFGTGVFFTALQLATALILFLAANTAFADFPRLCSFVARDGFLPRQLTSIGDKLVFQNGIVLLSAAAIGLLIVFDVKTHALIPLYAMGVFVSFTLSQAGMFVRFRRKHRDIATRSMKIPPKPVGPAGARVRALRSLNFKSAISGFGAVATFIVTCILLYTKFLEGAWLIVVALSIMLFVFWVIRKHYDYLERKLHVTKLDSLPKVKTVVLLLVPGMHKGILEAISYSKALAKDCRALHVTLDPKSVGRIKEDWQSFGADIPLVILDSPYRSLVEPICEYVDETLADSPNLMVTVIVPQAVSRRLWTRLLHRNVAISLKIALASRKNVVVTDVRYFVD